jgi:hypothetical protein
MLQLYKFTIFFFSRFAQPQSKCLLLFVQKMNSLLMRSKSAVCCAAFATNARLNPRNLEPRYTAGITQPIFFNYVWAKQSHFPWRRGIVVIASSSGSEDPGFESHQGVRFLRLYTLQCCYHNLKRTAIVCI